MTMNKTQVPPQDSRLTRRSFLGSTSKLVAGGALLGALPVERFAHGAAADGLLKVALIGCGGRGSGAANQALNTGKCKLVAMADAFQDRMTGSLNSLRNAHADHVDVPASRMFTGFEGYKAATDEADVVVLGAPPGFRPLHYEYAVQKGKHIFMEKPVATDGPGIRKMLAAAEEAKKKNLKIVVGLQRRYEPGYLETIQRIRDGAIGEVVAMRCYWNDAGVWVNPRQPNQTEMEFQMRNWYYFVWLSGDHIVEQHVHNLDVCNWVKGAYPRRCQGMGGRQVRTAKEYGEIFDHHAVEFEYPDGTRMFSQCRHIRNCWSNVSEHAVGTTGTCEVGKPHVIRDLNGKITWRFRAVNVDPYQKEHDVLFDAIVNNTPHDDSDYGIKSTLTGIRGRMATYGGQQVLWDDALESEINLFPDKLAWDAMPKVLPDADGFYPVAVPGRSVVV
jgi:myo-inositol 2-dehydrogenase / D-chiro-inositol 1-dehydrogenase